MNRLEDQGWDAPGQKPTRQVSRAGEKSMANLTHRLTEYKSHGKSAISSPTHTS